jgi:hypothetical protein
MVRQLKEIVESGKTKANARIKEADTIKVPAYPQPQQYRSWRAAV